MKQFLLKTKIIFSLGVTNFCRILVYRLSIKLGISATQKLKEKKITANDFFYFPKNISDKKLTAKSKWLTHHYYFGWYQHKSITPPNWHLNPFNNTISRDSKKDWWQILDFNLKLGDIKTVWEASRFDWVIAFAQAAALGDRKSLDKLNIWLADWCESNPPYKGVNWKCGQESSIRLMHLCIAASILHQHDAPSDTLIQLLNIHLKRIAPTIGYAIAQNNNHGTSEAAALYMGGSWLYYLGDKSAIKYKNIGVRWLENRAKQLISNDGTFSQYSLNYHRVMLDTYCMVEYWRRLLVLPIFSEVAYQKLTLATNWLYQMVQVEIGDVPNLGANDGARLFPLSATDYRDYRPSVQLASVLFNRQLAYKGDGDWNIPLQWLNIKLPEETLPPVTSCDFSSSGYSLLRNNKAFVLFTIPRYKFRPSQSDALHIDFWLNGENLLRDGGTYSYNVDDEVTQQFSGTAGHNVVQFDDRDQMPRISRFLLGAWLKAKEIIPVAVNKNGVLDTSAAYQDYRGAYHHRSVKLSNNKLTVIDTIKGFKQKAVIRWRLKPDNWTIDTKEKVISNNEHSIRISSSSNIVRFEIVEGWESRYYLQRTPLPVLEIELNSATSIKMEYIW